MSGMDIDSFYTLNKECKGEIKVKGSRFYGYAKSVNTKNEALTLVHTVSRKLHNATHHCYGYRIGLGDHTITRCSDAGEPSGTAGKPILEAISGRLLTNVICVVVRYFGGTKLGKGGLIRAYHQCACITLDRGGKRKEFLTIQLKLLFDYNDTGIVMSTISRFEGNVLETQYNHEIALFCSIRVSQQAEFVRTLRDLTGGKIKILKEEVILR